MKLSLNKKKIKTLSKDNANVPSNLTPQVAGGNFDNSKFICTYTRYAFWTCECNEQ